MPAIVKKFKNKELFIALYFLLFILGLTVGITPKFYNEFRVLELVMLFGFGCYGLVNQRQYISKIELLFLAYICIGSLFWQNYEFIVVDMLLAYLLYKAFFLLEYNELVTKVIIFASLSIFLLLPLSIGDYIITGNYDPVGIQCHGISGYMIVIYSSYLSLQFGSIL